MNSEGNLVETVAQVIAELEGDGAGGQEGQEGQEGQDGRGIT